MWPKSKQIKIRCSYIHVVRAGCFDTKYMRTASETLSENAAVIFVDASIDLLDEAHGSASLSSDKLKFTKSV